MSSIFFLEGFFSEWGMKESRPLRQAAASAAPPPSPAPRGMDFSRRKSACKPKACAALRTVFSFVMVSLEVRRLCPGYVMCRVSHRERKRT